MAKKSISSASSAVRPTSTQRAVYEVTTPYYPPRTPDQRYTFKQTWPITPSDRAPAASLAPEAVLDVLRDWRRARSALSTQRMGQQSRAASIRVGMRYGSRSVPGRKVSALFPPTPRWRCATQRSRRGTTCRGRKAGAERGRSRIRGLAGADRPSVGRVLRALEELELFDNMVIVYIVGDKGASGERRSPVHSLRRSWSKTSPLGRPRHSASMPKDATPNQATTHHFPSPEPAPGNTSSATPTTPRPKHRQPRAPSAGLSIFAAGSTGLARPSWVPSGRDPTRSRQRLLAAVGLRRRPLLRSPTVSFR